MYSNLYSHPCEFHTIPNNYDNWLSTCVSRATSNRDIAKFSVYREISQNLLFNAKNSLFRDKSRIYLFFMINYFHNLCMFFHQTVLFWPNGTTGALWFNHTHLVSRPFWSPLAQKRQDKKGQKWTLRDKKYQKYDKISTKGTKEDKKGHKSTKNLDILRF